MVTFSSQGVRQPNSLPHVWSRPRTSNLWTKTCTAPDPQHQTDATKNLQCWRRTAQHREPYPGGLACGARDLYGLGAAIVALLNVELYLLAFCQAAEAVCHNAGLQAAQETGSRNIRVGPCGMPQGLRHSHNAQQKLCGTELPVQPGMLQLPGRLGMRTWRWQNICRKMDKHALVLTPARLQKPTW